MSNKRRLRKKRKKKIIKRLKFISFFCIFILILVSIYFGAYLFSKDEESLYFDSINALITHDSFYATVGSNNDNRNHFEKAKISKYNEKKEKTFEKLYNIGFNSTFFGIVMDKDSLVAVGSYEKTEKDYKDSVRKALIVKYDSTGEIEFEKDFSILDNSKFTNIISVDDGYLVTGQSIYKKNRVGKSDGGAILVKYDKNGKLLWSKTYGSNKVGIYNNLICMDNFIYTVGADDNNLGIISKYDLDGNLILSNDYKYTDKIGFSGIVSVENKIFVSGSNDTNAMLVEYDTECNYVKQSIYESEGDIRFNKLISDNHNNLIVIGTVVNYHNNKGKSFKKSDCDGIIGKYNSLLEEISVATYGDERDDYFTDIQIVNGNYLVVGYSSYEDGSYLSKFISYSDALKVLGVE